MVTFTVSSSTEAPLRLKTPIQESFELHDHTSATLLFVSCGERGGGNVFSSFLSLFVVLLIFKNNFVPKTLRFYVCSLTSHV